jgi:cellulose synthase/poly-beta-1,6-N-acetylglucosamine synthase-like glycosyltransferase
MDINCSPIEYTLLSVFVAAFLVQMFYYLRYYLTTGRAGNGGDVETHQTPVSVVICARNEAANLRRHLPSILKQRHHDFEVIVVNDSSEDDSDIVLSELKEQYPHLKISTITKDPRFHHNKKLAQLIGIKAASNDFLLLTDADCLPESDKWLTMMTAPMVDGKDIVLGYGGYMKSRGLLNLYIRFDAFFIAMQYAGMALRGKPYMGVGRNLAYRKELFMKNNGFSSHYHLASGDDDLFVNSNATSANTAVVINSEAHTRSIPPAKLKEFIKQKRRHFTTAPYYSFADRFRLFLEPFSRVFFYSTAAVLLSLLCLWQAVAAVAGLTIIVKIVTFFKASGKLNETGLILPAIFFDIISPVVNSLLYIAKFGNQAGKNAWR